MAINQRVYRYVGCNEHAPPIELEVGGEKRTVSAGEIVDDLSLDGDARFMAILNPEWIDPPTKPQKGKKPDTD